MRHHQYNLYERCYGVDVSDNWIFEVVPAEDEPANWINDDGRPAYTITTLLIENIEVVKGDRYRMFYVVRAGHTTHPVPQDFEILSQPFTSRKGALDFIKNTFDKEHRNEYDTIVVTLR